MEYMCRLFDTVILSTWDEDKGKLPAQNYEVIYNKKPSNPGFSNRNYQRFSTSQGLKLAESLGCTHILKWRTDMLPTKLDIGKLLEWSSCKVPAGADSRIVMSAFRNLTVDPDCFSSFPDLFAFGSAKMMKILWDDYGFDYSKPFNLPPDMIDEYKIEVNNDEIWMNGGNYTDCYDAHVELYAHFKYRMQRQLNKKLSHFSIAKDVLYLINHKRLGICWFGPKEGFRSITQALQHPWWTEMTWKMGKPFVNEPGYPEKFWWQKIKRKITPYIVKSEIAKEESWYKEHLNG